MSDLPQTRQSLLIRLKDRSEDAWSEFMVIYEKSIFDFARRRGLQEADARDVTQEVLAAVGEKVDSWNHDPTKGKFRGWLFRVARNIAVDKIIELSKKASRGGSQAAQVLSEFPDRRDEETAQFWMDYRRQLMHWAAEQVRPTVSETSWKAFWLTAIENRSVAEVAEKLDLDSGNIYAAKFRVVDKIRKLVERFDDPDGVADLPFGDLRTSK